MKFHEALQARRIRHTSKPGGLHLGLNKMLGINGELINGELINGELINGELINGELISKLTIFLLLSVLI